MKAYYVNTGQGQIPWISLIAILSVSLTVNLPGLAISPIMGKLHALFPHVTDLEIQLLQVLPNVSVIPFILLSGKISTRATQMWVLGAGLLIFAFSGLLSMWASSIRSLIWLSCLTGVGCGLVIPLAASLISQYFTGGQRAWALGLKSGLSNFMVIVATIYVGAVARFDWHASFAAYLVPLIPLVLIPFMRRGFLMRSGKESASLSTSEPDGDVNTAPVRYRYLHIAALIAVYITITYAAMVISYYIPFTMQLYGYGPTDAGVATSMFYLAAFLAGFSLRPVGRCLRSATMPVAFGIMAAGLVLIGILHTMIWYILGIFILGLGYGLLQPTLYDKTTRLAPSAQASTRFFSYLLAGNYVGIAVVPFVIDYVAGVGGFAPSSAPSYLFAAACCGVLMIGSVVFVRSFTFCYHKQ